MLRGKTRARIFRTRNIIRVYFIVGVRFVLCEMTYWRGKGRGGGGWNSRVIYRPNPFSRVFPPPKLSRVPRILGREGVGRERR